MAKPTANIVIVESGADAARVLGAGYPGCEINYVLCCRPDEPLEDFAAHVLQRLGLLTKTATITRISYIVAGGDGHPLSRQKFLEGLAVLLEGGADLELLAASGERLDLLQVIEPLLRVARNDVNLRAVRLPTAAPRTAAPRAPLLEPTRTGTACTPAPSREVRAASPRRDSGTRWVQPTLDEPTLASA